MSRRSILAAPPTDCRSRAVILIQGSAARPDGLSAPLLDRDNTRHFVRMLQLKRERELYHFAFAIFGMTVPLLVAFRAGDADGGRPPGDVSDYCS